MPIWLKPDKYFLFYKASEVQPWKSAMLVKIAHFEYF